MSAADQPVRGLGRDEEEDSSFDDMEWAVPLHNRNPVDNAGFRLIKSRVQSTNEDGPDINQFLTFVESFSVINNWRAAHQYPLNTFQVTLRNKSRRVDQNCIIAQRIKRLSSIRHKLERFNTMQFSQMQDIAGCRSILENKDQVYSLVESYKNSELRHRLRRTVDYIEKPRESGYRGIHLLYEYFSDKESKKVYNGLKIEMQIRSALQHAWATAVETVGTFTRQALKSSLGEQNWLRFFSLMGTAIAFREDAPPVPGTPTNPGELVAELKDFAARLDVINLLDGYRTALKTIEQPSATSAHFYLLQLDPAARETKITGFRGGQSQQAAEEYLTAERAISEASSSQAVLVSVDSISQLYRAYPNYFLDTRVFVGLVEEVLSD